jgi:hypothetical protein
MKPTHASTHVLHSPDHMHATGGSSTSSERPRVLFTVCGVASLALDRGAHPANGRPCSAIIPKLR